MSEGRKPSQAVVVDGVLHVFYGAADKVCAVASTPLEDLISYLVLHQVQHEA